MNNDSLRYLKILWDLEAAMAKKHTIQLLLFKFFAHLFSNYIVINFQCVLCQEISQYVYLEWKRKLNLLSIAIISSFYKWETLLPFGKGVSFWCVLSKHAFCKKPRSLPVISVFSKINVNITLVFLKTWSSLHAFSTLWRSPLTELGCYLGKIVQVGAHIDTHARKRFLFLAQTVLFLDLPVFEWVKSSLINFMSLRAKPAKNDSWVLYCMCIMRAARTAAKGTHLALSQKKTC